MQIPRKMSAQNVMASISRTLGTRHGPAASSECNSAGNNGKPGPGAAALTGSEVKFAGEESKDKLYEPKHKQKLVRVLTVVAYIISVSMAAIVLSLYYMYIWKPTDDIYNKLRANATNATAAASTVKTLCSEIGQAVANEPMDGSPLDGTSPLAPTTDAPRAPRAPDEPSPAQPTRSLYKTLTTPPSGSAEPAEQYPGAAREDYPEPGTIAPADEALDD